MAVRGSKSEVRRSFGALGPVLPVMFVISGIVNLLALTGSLYMLQVYDRVLTSGSVPTLVALSVLALGLYAFMGALEVIRGQVLVRLASRVERRLARMAHEAIMKLPFFAGQKGDPMQPMRDVDAIRSYLAGQGPVAILDMPWMPLYVAFVFLLHPILGWITLAGAAVLFGLTLITERMVQEPTTKAGTAMRERVTLAEASHRNAEVLRAMGFRHRLTHSYERASLNHLAAQERLSDVVGGLSVVSKLFRMVLQSALLGLGAYLTLKGQMSAGAIIACSVASSRALSPIEVAIANWKSFVSARQSATRLDSVLAALPKDPEPLELPAPKSSLTLEGVTVPVPGTQRILLNNVTLKLEAGQALAVIGPSAAGKSTLARAIAGVWPLARGSVRLDGAPLDRWSVEALGAHIGYLPQDIELFDGTVTENISRFEEEPDSKKVIAAAKAADVHEMILRLPNGYETRVGEGGANISAGQRQRIGLARALYGDPFLLVLDEPNSNLDAEGEAALVRALETVKDRGGIVVVIAHRPSVLAAVDQVAVINSGQVSAIGPRDEILKKVLRQQQAPGASLGAPPAAAAASEA